MNKLFLFSLFSIFPPLAAWPFFLTESPPAPVPERPPFTIMIDPLGDARNPGRTIADTYERSLTMQCAEELKRTLESAIPRCRVILTRFPGEAVEPFQTITFANRLGVNLYVSIGFFHHTKGTPQIFWYTLLYDPATDFIAKKGAELELLPYDQAYKLSLAKTKQYSLLATSACAEAAKTASIICHAPHAIPYKPLIGIMAPALGIEIGIQHIQEAKLMVPLITQALTAIILS